MCKNFHYASQRTWPCPCRLSSTPPDYRRTMAVSWFEMATRLCANYTLG
jgi:hypothetical protein